MTSSPPQLVWIGFFRGTEHARAAIQDLMQAGLPPDVIHVIGGSGNAETTAAGIRTLGIAERDERSLATCIEQGGIVVAVSPHAAFSQEVETIFLRYQAAQESETATDDEHERTTSSLPVGGHFGLRLSGDCAPRMAHP
jgi:hypothetical protein